MQNDLKGFPVEQRAALALLVPTTDNAAVNAIIRQKLVLEAAIKIAGAQPGLDYAGAVAKARGLMDALGLGGDKSGPEPLADAGKRAMPRAMALVEIVPQPEWNPFRKVERCLSEPVDVWTDEQGERREAPCAAARPHYVNRTWWWLEAADGE